jgi:hypothetical protein
MKAKSGPEWSSTMTSWIMVSSSGVGVVHRDAAGLGQQHQEQRRGRERQHRGGAPPSARRSMRASISARE